MTEREEDVGEGGRDIVRAREDVVRVCEDAGAEVALRRLSRERSEETLGLRVRFKEDSSCFAPSFDRSSDSRRSMV